MQFRTGPGACTVQNEPPHTAPAGPFQTPPSNKATVHEGSATVWLFEAVLEVAKGAGLVGRKRVLDSTSLCSPPR